jgi:hypothetical protein
VINLALSPDDRVLVLALRNGDMVRIDTATGAETARFIAADDDEGDGIASMAFASDGRLAVGTRQGPVQL